MNSNAKVIQFTRTEELISASPAKRTAAGSFTGADFQSNTPPKRSHAAEALKSIDDINKITEYLKSKGRYRDNLIFIMGINFGLRVGDLLRLKVGDLIDSSDHSYKQEITIAEQKTSKRDGEGNITKYKYHTCYMNESVMDSLDLYFSTLGRSVDLNEYLFRNISNSNQGKNEPLERYSVERILKRTINDECGINVRASTHLLRKTFAYHILMNAPDKQNAVAFLQKVTGHASKDAVMAYIGVTADEIKDACWNLQLGSAKKRPVGELTAIESMEQATVYKDGYKVIEL